MVVLCVADRYVCQGYTVLSVLLVVRCPHVCMCTHTSSADVAMHGCRGIRLGVCQLRACVGG